MHGNRLLSMPYQAKPQRFARMTLRCLLIIVVSVFAVRYGAAAEPTSAQPVTPTPAPTGSVDVRDVLLMLETGPVHLRLHIAVGGQSPADARKATMARLLETLDTNRDGLLSRSEAQRSPLFREKQRPGAEKFIKSIGADLRLTPRDIEQRLDRLGGETITYRQNTTASDSDTNVFKLLDANSDGIVDKDEMFEAVDLLLAKDLDDDECVTLDEVAPLPDPMTMPVNVVPTTPRPAGPSVADILRDTHQTLLPAQLLQKYDKDRNQKLSAAELHWSAEKLAACDLDRDGQLNRRELEKIKLAPVDVELAVDVVRPKNGEPMLKVIAATVERSDADNYPDLATITLPQAVITFSTREVDPYEDSMTIALRTFNELDVDNNGYLDRDETMSRERFGRGLFDQIDADGDDKIFGEEMKEFIRARGEPVASSCQVTVYDDGAGFFSAIDTNGDRRISMREMRYADKTLVTMQRDDVPGLGENEPAKRYRIEFMRGVFNPFGNTDRMLDNPATQTTVAQTRPRAVGPVWFQRWDRNNDGDITWREFLGPRDVFEQLDVDRDEMIDPREAAAASGPSTGNPKATLQPMSASTGP